MIKSITTGIMACLVISLVATSVAQYYNAPAMLLCLLSGIALNFISRKSITREGVNFTAKTILRAGVVLIGARIMFSDFMALGGEILALVIFSTASVVIVGLILTKRLGLQTEQGILIGGATAICGASAALAISAMLPQTKTLEQNTLIAVIGVTLMGTLAMIMYPALIVLLGFNDYQAGIFIGGTIHDVSQVVGAGYSISEEAGDTAILIKLMRVFLLVPLLLLFIFGFNKQKHEENPKRVAFPIFLLGFLCLMTLNSFHLIPADITAILKNISQWFLLMAISAVGIKTSPKALLSLGYKPIILIGCEAGFILTLYLVFLFIHPNI